MCLNWWVDIKGILWNAPYLLLLFEKAKLLKICNHILKFILFSKSRLQINQLKNYSIWQTAPAAVSASFNLLASSWDRSALTTVGQDSTNFLACTKFIPSTRFLISLISVIFFAASNDSSLTVNEVWKRKGYFYMKMKIVRICASHVTIPW